MTNPLLDELVQEEVIHSTELALPTLGRFYKPGVLIEGADPTSIEINPIGIVAEMRLNDPFVLVSGRATPKIIRSVAPAIAQPDQLCSIDINAILIAARIVSHGPKMKIKVTCNNPKLDKEKKPVCTNEDDLEVDLTDLIMKYGPVSDEDLQSYIVKLPTTGQTVCIQPPTYATSLESLKSAVNAEKSYLEIKDKKAMDLLQDADTANQYEALIELTARTSLSALVDQIFYVETRKGDKYVDKDVIVEWLERIPPVDVKKIQERMGELAMALVDMNQISYKCSNCDHVNPVLISLDPQQLFFYESEASPPPKKSSPSSRKKTSGGKRPSRTSQR